MLDPFLYTNAHELQKHDANLILDQYFSMFKWKENGGDRIMDVGCGTADVLKECLLPRLPTNFGELVATDFSEEMIQFAKNNLKHPKFTFQTLEIASLNLPATLEEGFDHVVSFYCLNWVQNQRQALTNINRMLKTNGECLMLVLGKFMPYFIFTKMSKSLKWSPYMQDFPKYISPYASLEQPHLQFEELLNDTGFYVRVCRSEDTSYVFPSIKRFMSWLSGADPILPQIPDDLKNDYLEDMATEMRNLGMVETTKDTQQEIVRLSYSYLVAVASKST